MKENEKQKINEENNENEIVKAEEIKVEKEEVKEENTNLEEKKEKDSKIEKQEEKNKKEEKFEEIKPKKKRTKITIVLIILIIILFLVLSTIFAILNMGNSNIVNGVHIEGVNISNLSNEQAILLVNQNLEKIDTVELVYGEYSTIVKLEEIGVKIEYKKSIDEAIKLGKTNNIIIDNYSILIANIFEKHIPLEIKLDEEKVNETIKNIQAEIPEAIKEYSYEIKDDKLIIANGKSGQKIIVDELIENIKESIKEQFNGKTEIINIPTRVENPQLIDIQKIYSEIYKEAKDAYIIEEPFELHKEENGIDLGITIAEAKEILKENKETYTIPLKITKPNVYVKDLGDKLFKQTLAKYTTIYDAGNTNRSHNIALAAKTINGTILMPGETFSYNGVLGNTNKEKGYKVGTAYVGGKVVESYGGGICQVSSTLYNSVLYANLEIVQRYNHSYVVNYVPAGRDATVAYGGKDFKFKNTRKYPIKIVASAKNGVVSVSIMGIKEEIEYEIVLTSEVLSTTKRTVVYEDNSALEEGTEKVIQKGYDGKKSIAYKTVKLNGKTISKTVLSKDTYKPMAKIIERGTKKVVTTPSVTPSITPANPDTTISNTNNENANI